jgi:D-aminoacyl-tRNA deacylase
VQKEKSYLHIIIRFCQLNVLKFKNLLVMRLVVQRVTSSSVSIAGKGIVASIGKGACVLIGIGTEDGDREITWAAQTIVEAKLWDDSEGRPWKESMKMKNFGVLLVSQFTLYGKTPKKGKLDFHHAMSPAAAQAVYDSIVAKVRAEMGDNTQCGEFGADMEVR